MLGEPLNSQIVVAGAFMGFGLWMHLTERHLHEHQHEVLEHVHSHIHDTHPSSAPA